MAAEERTSFVSPDDLKRKLSRTTTVEKNLLPTAEDLKKDPEDDRIAADAALQEKKEVLKKVDMEVRQRLPTSDDINAEKEAPQKAGEALAEAKRKLSRAKTTEKQALPTPEDIQAEKRDRSCSAFRTVQYSAEEVEGLIKKFEGAAKKQVEKAPDDIATIEKDLLTVGIKTAENALLVVTEALRDICSKAVKGTTTADREYLDDVFGRGCNCERFIRLRDVIPKVIFSAMNAKDPRWKELQAKMETIEQILRQRGSFKATVIVTKPKAVSYAKLAKTESVDVGEEVSFEPALDGQGVTFSVQPALPEGLSIDETTGVISGQANEESSATAYTVTATNAAGSVSTNFTLGVTQPAPTALTYPSLSPEYLVGAEVKGIPQIEGGVCNDFSVVPALPTGISLNPTTGVLSGSSSEVVDANTYRITCKNGRGQMVCELRLDVTEPAPKALTYPTLAEQYFVDAPIDIKPDTQGSTCRSFSVAPALPKGMSLNPATGELSGSPSEGTSSATYRITGKNKRGQAVCEFRLSVTKPKEDLIKKICACAELPPLYELDPGKEDAYTWMVYMVHRVHLNDGSLTELDFTDKEMPLPQQQARVAPKLMKALESNTTLTDLKLSHTNLQKETGEELADAMRVNTTLKVINVAKNHLDSECIMRMASQIKENTGTSIETFNCSFQKSMGEFLGNTCELALVELMKENSTITKLPVSLQDSAARNNIDRYIIRNVDRARRLAAGGSGDAEVVAEVRTVSTLELQSAPEGKSVGEVFVEDVEIVAIVRAFCVEKGQLPTKDQLQAFAKNQGQSVPFAKAASVMKVFCHKLLDAAIDGKVVLADAQDTKAAGTLRSWSSPSETSWSVLLKEDSGKLIEYKGNKLVVKFGNDFASWLRV